MKRLRFHLQRHHRGQSFIELAFVFGLLMTMLAGVIEFGNLLNQYIILIDGAREGARAASNADPFNRPDYTNNDSFYSTIDDLIEGTVDGDPDHPNAQPAVIIPLKLVDDNDDDVVITVYSIDTAGNLVGFPDDDGWSRYGNQTTKFDTSELKSRVISAPGAPLTGMVVVEIFYHYPSILKILPEDFTLHAYSIMPVTAAEPTPVPP